MMRLQNRLLSEVVPSIKGSVRGNAGRAPEGRLLPLLVLSNQGCFTPQEALDVGLPVVLIICGIHAGEVEGKEAALMLVRDILGNRYGKVPSCTCCRLVCVIRGIHASSSYTHHPRFGSNCRGLTNRLDLLLETYAYLPFEQRVQAAYSFLRESLIYVAEHGTEIVELLDSCIEPPARVAVRYRLEAFEDRVAEILTRKP